MIIEGKRGKGKLKKRWLDRIENNMKAADLCVGNVDNREMWRSRKRVPDPNVVYGKYFRGRGSSC